MFRENGSMQGQHDTERLALALHHNDLSGIHMTGDCIDRVFKRGQLVAVREGHNLVVNSFLSLVMCLLKQQNGYSGIQYWAVGSGAAAWDSELPTPDVNATRLTKEIGRVPIAAGEILFLDREFNETSTPTNILQIKHLFTEDDCNGPWREFGIFGGNATLSANSGIMVNKRHHAVLTKTEEMTVERVLRFTLSLT